MEGLVTFTQDPNNLSIFLLSPVLNASFSDRVEVVVNKFPQWAYGYFVRSMYNAQLRNNGPQAKLDLQKCIEILEIYKTFPECINFHKEYSTQLNRY